MHGSPSPCDGVAGRRTRSTAKKGCRSQAVVRNLRGAVRVRGSQHGQSSRGVDRADPIRQSS
jgi:hypothetical protein